MLHRHPVIRSRPAPRRRDPRRSLSLPLSILVAALVILGSPGTPAAAKQKPDSALTRAVEAITETFRSGRTGPLRPLLSPAGKVYISSGSLAASPSFYSRDQVEALLRQAFRQIKSLHFRIEVKRSRGADPGESVILCPATWRYAEKGTRKETRLRFLLARRAEGWALSEIRETR